MAERNYKKDEAIKVVYQAAGSKTGAVVNLQVYDETDTEDVAQAAVLTEIGVSGRYVGTFTPDADGDWSIQIADDQGGKAVKHYSVGDYNLQDVGANLQSTETKVDGLTTDLDIVEGKVDTVEGKVDTVEGKVDSVETKVDTLTAGLGTVESKIDELESPPMIG